MTSTALPLGPIHILAADTLERVGWIQGEEVNDAGQACLTGALKLCAPVPGDWLLARAVYRLNGHDERWNDNDQRTAGEVINYLRSAEITDIDLALTFGPQWQAIVALVRRAAVLTDQDTRDLYVIWGTDRDDARNRVWDATHNAARNDAQDAAYDATSGAAHEVTSGAARDPAREAAREAARDAAWALVVRDLIGQRGFTQAHYNLLTGPWASVIGPVHPDDPSCQKVS